MANSTSGTTCTQDGLAHHGVAKDQERYKLQQENQRLLKELNKARAVIERQNREIETMRRTMDKKNKDQSATVLYPSSLAEQESSSCSSSVGTSQHTSCSVIFIENRRIPEIHHAAPASSDESNDPQTPPRIRRDPPPSRIQIQQVVHDDDGNATPSAEVSRRVSSITMPDATITPPLVEARLIHENEEIASSSIAPVSQILAHREVPTKPEDKRTLPLASDVRATTNKRLVRRPTPLPSTPERNLPNSNSNSSSSSSSDGGSSGKTGAPGREKNDKQGMRCPLFSVKEESDRLQRCRPHTKHTIVAQVDGGVAPVSSFKVAAVAPSNDDRANSNVTEKASNTAASVFQAMQRRPKLVTKSPPPPVRVDRKTPRDAPGLAPPKRTASPPWVNVRASEASILSTAANAKRPIPTLEVEKHPLSDAVGGSGSYTGSMDSKTLLPDGFGTMIYRTRGKVYTGDWEQGRYHGYGKLTDSHGNVYDGPFARGRKEGQEEATMNFHDGRRFKGRFHADKMREGILQFVDGSFYEGLLENDKRNGFGLYCFQNGDQYEGQWKNDLMHGRGRMEWKSDGAWYNGDWEYGIQHGVGTEANAAGRILHQGHFNQGQPVSKAEPVV